MNRTLGSVQGGSGSNRSSEPNFSITICRYVFLFFSYFLTNHAGSQRPTTANEGQRRSTKAHSRAVHRHRIYGCTVTVYTVSVSVPSVIEGLVIRYGGRYGVVP